MQNFVLVAVILSAFSATLFVQGVGASSNVVISEDIGIDESIELLRRVPLQQTRQQQQSTTTTTNDDNAMSRLLKRHNNNGKNNNDTNNKNNDDDEAVLLETHDEHITPGDGFGGGGGGGVPSIEELQHEYDLAAEAKEYSKTDLLASELKDNEKEGIVIDDDDVGKVAGIVNNNIDNNDDNNKSAGKSGKSEEDASSSSMSMNNIRTESKQSKVHTSKSRKESTGVCTKRLTLAYNATQKIPDQFPQIDTPDDVTALCAFRSNADANYGCLGFYYDPKKEPYFFKGVTDTTTAIGADDPEPIAFALINLYCDCYYGYDLGCINDLPSTPQEREEYCIFAGVWNGDFDSSMMSGSTGKSGKEGGGLSQEVLDCGCFWIGQEKEKVGNCPGVDLGYFYVSPDDALSAFLS